ncbi:cupin domain-containing protein [Rhodococcus sp. NPDC058521]|uniref:cupin domain-containing protein n=1 Tax=Rhodococcus sp. NPDC058521 TaxID=3346536 RepID=UPI00365E3295
MTLSELVADEPTTAFHLVREGDRTARESANGVLAPLSGSYPGLDAVHLTVPASTTAPRAQHSGEEWLYVLCGPLEVVIGSEVLVLQSGDAVHFPSHTSHSVRNVGEAPAEVLLVSKAT